MNTKVEIKSLLTEEILFSAAVNQPIRLALKAALERAVTSGADLTGADLRGARLTGARLSGAYLSGAYLGDADLGDAPVIENIHQKVYAAASQPDALDMDVWHNSCGTAHCRAGWVVTLAGEAGKELESKIGTAGAALAIYLKSDPERFKTERIPNFYTPVNDFVDRLESARVIRQLPAPKGECEVLPPPAAGWLPGAYVAPGDGSGGRSSPLVAL